MDEQEGPMEVLLKQVVSLLSSLDQGQKTLISLLTSERERSGTEKRQREETRIVEERETVRENDASRRELEQVGEQVAEKQAEVMKLAGEGETQVSPLEPQKAGGKREIEREVVETNVNGEDQEEGECLDETEQQDEDEESEQEASSEEDLASNFSFFRMFSS